MGEREGEYTTLKLRKGEELKPKAQPGVKNLWTEVWKKGIYKRIEK